MDNHDLTLTIVLLEVAIIQFLVIISILIYSVVKRRKRSRILASMLIDVNKEMDSRKTMIAIALKGLKADNSTELAGALAKAEADHYAALADILHRNDLKGPDKIRNATSMLLAPLLSAAKAASPSVATATTQIVDDEPVIPNVDQAIDELLTDRHASSAVNPEFDLSRKENIAEIPDTLLFDENNAENKKNK